MFIRVFVCGFCCCWFCCCWILSTVYLLNHGSVTSHIYKNLLRFLCNKMPCCPIFFSFFLLFILFDSRALTFCFVIAVSRNGFCTDRWRCSKCRCVQFYFSAEITFTLNNTTHLYNTWGYKHYNTTHVIFKQIIGSHFLLKKKPQNMILPLSEMISFYSW